MRFFEIHEPYYALLKAESVEGASEKYVEVVAGDSIERPLITRYFTEVSRDNALAKFSQTPGENKKLFPVKTVVEEFNAQANEVLIIDGTLI